ncbi:hypothetical protein [Leptospira adleri]|uniref:Alpha/beta hydrolase n=1 Tax=Leptospira adleri TaxID=2023186 RepID=A0A2M9YLA1_9LEPT|nr:hypothetical protein [Leptospira adleri]PJZ52328.1 hypothetical protein CH380_15620 [Leptospira adleri]PJZ63535.1 hypothetical protein CH376_02640 [Leptospira adleri]
MNKRICTIVILTLLSTVPVKSEVDLEYLEYYPEDYDRSKGVLIIIHSKAYDWDHYLKFGKSIADALRVPLVVPVFKKEYWNDYAVVIDGKQRGDIFLQENLKKVESEHKVNINRLYMYGHSGGAQFVHRYILMYGSRVRKAFISAPGWYTFPDFGKEFPTGLQKRKDFPDDVSLEFKNFCKTQLSVTVGELDTTDPAVPKDGSYGKNRLELSKNWVVSLNRFLKRECSEVAEIPLHITPGQGHTGSSNSAQKQRVIEFFNR